MALLTTKIADSKGRIALGSEFAGRTFIIRRRESGRIEIEPAVVIPEREAWLYKNKEALAAVERGIDQARNRQFSSSPPDLAKGAELARRITDAS